MPITAEQISVLTDEELRDLLVMIVKESGDRQRRKAQDDWHDQSAALALQLQRRPKT
jgi:hypothetical protein